jgi:hypothetical protein
VLRYGDIVMIEGLRWLVEAEGPDGAGVIVAKLVPLDPQPSRQAFDASGLTNCRRSATPWV